MSDLETQSPAPSESNLTLWDAGQYFCLLSGSDARTSDYEISFRAMPINIPDHSHGDERDTFNTKTLGDLVCRSDGLLVVESRFRA